MMFPDTIKVTKITRDSTYGTRTNGKVKTYKALVQDEVETRYSNNGKIREYDTLIFVDPIAAINRGDKILIYKRYGVVQTNEVEREVQIVKEVGGLHLHHLEVYL